MTQATLRLRTLGNKKKSGKFQNFIELLPTPHFSRNETFFSSCKNLLKNRN